MSNYARLMGVDCGLEVGESWGGGGLKGKCVFIFFPKMFAYQKHGLIIYRKGKATKRMVFDKTRTKKHILT